MTVLRREIILETAVDNYNRRTGSRIIVFDVQDEVDGTPCPEYKSVNNIIEADNDYKVVKSFAETHINDLDNMLIVNPDISIPLKLNSNTWVTPKNVTMFVLRNIKPKC